MEFYIVVCILVTLSIEINGFRNGESISTASERLYCGSRPVDRVPFHVSDRCNGTCETRDDEPPYRIVVNNGRDDDMYWDEDVRVTIETIDSTSRWRVNGFAVFALDQNEDIVGRWAEGSIVQFSCGTALEGNTAVHERGNSRRQRMTLRWTPEGRNYGIITFRSIVVHSQDIYWSVKSNVSLSPEKTGEDNIDLAVEFIKLVNESSGGTRRGLTITDFRNSFDNRLKSGWDSRNMFGAFNRDLRVSDFFIDRSRRNSFNTAFSNSLRRISNRNSGGGSFLDRIRNGGFPGMQQNMFGNQNPFVAMMGGQQQSMFPGMSGLQGLNNQGNQQGMFGMRQGMGGQPGMMPGMGGQQGMMPGMGGQQGMMPGMGGQQGMMPGQQGMMPGQQGMMPGMRGQQGMMPGQQGMMPGMGGQQGMMPGQQGMMPGQQGMMPGMGGQQGMIPGMMPGMGNPQGMMPGMGGQQGSVPGMGGQQGMRLGMFPGMGAQQQGMFPPGMGGQSGAFPQGMRPPGIGGQPGMMSPGMGGMFPSGIGGQPGIGSPQLPGLGGIPSAAGPSSGGAPPPPPPFRSPVG